MSVTVTETVLAPESLENILLPDTTNCPLLPVIMPAGFRPLLQLMVAL